MSDETNYPHAPHRIDSKRAGEAYQEFARRCLNPFGVTFWNWADKQQQIALGENPQGWEIKLDTRCFSRDPDKKPTHQLSIEVQEKTKRENAQWIDSGILRKDNSWIYVQGNYEIIFVFAKNWLLRVYHQTITPEDVSEYNGTIRRFFLPIETALLGAALVLEITDRPNCGAQPLRKDEKGQWRL